MDDIHDMMDDIGEQNEIAEEISTALSQPIGFGAEIDKVSSAMPISRVSGWWGWEVHVNEESVGLPRDEHVAKNSLSLTLSVYGDKGLRSIDDPLPVMTMYSLCFN